MRSGSTTTVWYKAKIRRPRREQGAAKGRSFRPVGTSLTSPKTVMLRWVGGAEPWVEISYGGQRTKRPGTMELWELLMMLAGQEEPMQW